MADGALLWAYGVVPASQPAPESLRGLEGQAVAPVAHGGLAALASPVPSERFSGDELQQRLEDIDVVAEMARAHDAVLEAALAQGDVVPFRMCTIYETPQAIQAMLAAEAGRFCELLARLHDKAEWGVKAFLRPRAGAAPQPGPASGTEYLARRRAEREQAQMSREAIETAVAELHLRLADRAVADALSRPHDRSLTGDKGEMVLNGAYLVAREQAGEFVALFEALRREGEDQGLTLELTGPWPPYHFVAEARE